MVATRPATVADLPNALALVEAARQESPLTSSETDVAELLRVWFSQPESVLVVCENEQDLTGLALARIVEPGPLADVRVLEIEAIYVKPGYRRRGLAKSLLSSLVEVAHSRHASMVVAIPFSGQRAEQRLYSGLGFSLLGARRIVETGALLRRLGLRSANDLEDLVARRRRSRQTPAHGLPLTTPSHAGS